MKVETGDTVTIYQGFNGSLIVVGPLHIESPKEENGSFIFKLSQDVQIVKSRTEAPHA